MIVEDGAYIKGSIDIVRAEAIKAQDKQQTTALERSGIPVAPSFQAAYRIDKVAPRSCAA